VIVFAREINDPLTSLVKKLDAEVGKSKSVKALVLLMTDEDSADKKIKELTEKNKITKVNFGVDNPQGPPAWKIEKDAAVTVVFYKAHKIQASHAFKKGEFNDKATETVMGSLPKIVASN
jgi:hypothetical protein